MAMDQPEGMTEFMDRFFPHAFEQDRIVFLHPVTLIVEAVERGNAGLPVEVSLAEDIGQDGNEEIHIEKSEGLE